MAERRMFAKTIIDSDLFLDMPTSSRLLYFDLGMRADDDGFVNSPKKIAKLTGASEDDLRLLIAKNFIIPFETGVVVIRHWRVHNYIRGDRYNQTLCVEEKSELKLLENKTYERVHTSGLPDDIPLVDTGKVRLGKVSIDKVNKESKKESKKSFDEIIDSYTENQILRDELKAHLVVRKQKKSALTNRAIELELKNLDKLSTTDEGKIEIVRQSIVRGWIGFFEVKNSNNNPVSREETNEERLKRLKGG